MCVTIEGVVQSILNQTFADFDLPIIDESLPEIIGTSGVAGSPRRTDELAAAITRILQSSGTERAKWQRAIREDAERRHSPAARADLREELISLLLGSSHGASRNHR